MWLNNEGRIGLMDGLAVFIFIQINGLYEKTPAARLMTFAPVCAAAKNVVTHKTPARNGDTLSAMNKSLNFNIGLTRYS
jgi:hypothetical protein